MFVSAAAFSAVASSLIIVCSAAAAARLLADSAAGEPEGAGDVGEVRGPVMKGGVAWEKKYYFAFNNRVLPHRQYRRFQQDFWQ